MSPMISTPAARARSAIGWRLSGTPGAESQLIAEAVALRQLMRSRNLFNLDEFLGLAASDPRSYRAFMQQHLFDHCQTGPPGIDG